MSERILIFGETLLDDFGARQVVGGAPFNVARNLAAFGQPQIMVTRVGQDPAGEAVRNEFTRFSMSPEGVQSESIESNHKQRKKCLTRLGPAAV